MLVALSAMLPARLPGRATALSDRRCGALGAREDGGSTEPGSATALLERGGLATNVWAHFGHLMVTPDGGTRASSTEYRVLQAGQVTFMASHGR